MTEGNLLTTVVGSYPQPDWLIDREAMKSTRVPRVRYQGLWRIPEPFLAEAQNDATLLAIRDMERAGVDIISDGEIRRESYSNRFATALEGIDIEKPGKIAGSGGNITLVPRVVGTVRRSGPVQGADVEFLRRNTEGRIKVTVPGPFTMAQQALNEYYSDTESLAMDYAICVNQEVKELFQAGADVVQLDEPWLRVNPDGASEYAVRVIDKALEGVVGVTALHLCFGYAAVVSDKPAAYDFLTELAGCCVQQISIEAAQPKLDLSVLREFTDKTIILGVLALGDAAVEVPGKIAETIREALRYTQSDRLQLDPDCGMKYLPRATTFRKLQAMTSAAAMLRDSLGLN